MADSPRVAVTGATGLLGGPVARRLSAAGVAQRLLVRNPGRAPAVPHCEVVRASYDDAAAVISALRGVPLVLMVSASETPGRGGQHMTFVDAAVAAGVRQLVYTSFAGAAPDATFTLARDHHATEQHILDRGLTSTFLRDNLYLDFLPNLVGPDGVIRGPAGNGRVAAVAQDDIADVAVAMLRARPSTPGRRTTSRGRRRLPWTRSPAQLTQVTGREVTYHPETVEEAFASRAGMAPGWQLDAWVSTYLAVARGELAVTTDAVERLTGRPPRSLRQLLAAG